MLLRYLIGVIRIEENVIFAASMIDEFTKTDRNFNAGRGPEVAVASIILGRLEANVKHLGKANFRFSWSPGRFPCMTLGGYFWHGWQGRSNRTAWLVQVKFLTNRMANAESCLENVRLNRQRKAAHFGQAFRDRPRAVTWTLAQIGYPKYGRFLNAAEKG